MFASCDATTTTLRLHRLSPGMARRTFTASIPTDRTKRASFPTARASTRRCCGTPRNLRPQASHMSSLTGAPSRMLLRWRVVNSCLRRVLSALQNKSREPRPRGRGDSGKPGVVVVGFAYFLDADCAHLASLQVRPLEVTFETWAAFRAQGIATPAIAAWQTVVAGSTLWQNVLALYNNPAYADLVRAEGTARTLAPRTPRSSPSAPPQTRPCAGVQGRRDGQARHLCAGLGERRPDDHRRAAEQRRPQQRPRAG